MAKALLLFPPQWSPQHPHFALRALAGHLRHHGIDVDIRDLNIEYYDHVLSPVYLQRVRDRLHLDLEYLGTQSSFRLMLDPHSVDAHLDRVRLQAIKRFVDEHGEMLNHLPHLIMDAKETLKDPRRFYNPDMLIEALQVIDLALKAASTPYFPAQLNFNYFEQPGLMMNTNNLIAQVQDRRTNMFIPFYEEVLPDLLATKADYVGISINCFSQLVPGLTLAHMLRKAAPEGLHVGIGGNFFTRVTDALSQRPEFFEAFAHSLCFGEGEDQLLELVQALDRGESLESVPSLLYLDGGEVRKTRPRKALPMDQIGFQDLKGFPLDKYLTPELILTIRASKGCYWGKCSFCDSFYGVDDDVKSLDRLVEEIRFLRDTYGVRHFQFIDEAMRPAYMRKLAQRFIDEELNITWFCNGRIEKAFTPDLFEVLYAAGLRMVLWGYETGSPRILELINKGVGYQQRFDILRYASDAGIFNFNYLFFGYPTETREEAQMTIDSICQNTDLIHAYGRSVFTLNKQSPLYLEAEKHGILEVIEDVEELSTTLTYKATSGMDDTELRDALKSCTRQCLEAYEYGLWMYLRNRENIHLYLSRFGSEGVKNYRMERLAGATVVDNP
jgi:radical SAM superfamily enzyme YgiQ (UPF0313 family)